jgi:hypothetical protein
MLAWNGFHMLSQIARMYSMGCLLGLLSTTLLVLILRKPERPLSYCVLYVFVTLAALATHVYLWPLFITQLLWVLLAGIRRRGGLVGLARVQVLTFILATPLIAIAVYQKSTASRPPTVGPGAGILQYLQAGALFQLDARNLSETTVPAVAATLALIASLLLLAAAAIAWGRRATDPGSVGDLQGCGVMRPAVMPVAALLMTSSILLFAYVARTLLPGRSITAISRPAFCLRSSPRSTRCSVGARSGWHGCTGFRQERSPALRPFSHSFLRLPWCRWRSWPLSRW